MSSAYAIPVVPSEPFQAFTSNLNNIPYGFEFRWNTTVGAWYMTLLTVDDAVIQAGVRIVLGGVLRPSADARYPAGLFLAFDTSGTNVEATLDDFGERVQLLFIPNEV